MSVRSQSAFLRKAGTLTVWLIILCIYFLGVYNYVQIRNDTAVSVFLSAAYPDRKGAENILKQERKSEKPYDVCFYADAGLREISAKEGNRQAQAMTVYLKGNTAGYDWQAAALTEGDPDGCVIDGTTAWELFGNKVPGGQILFQGRTYTVRKVADWGQKILVFGAASADDTETELFIIVCLSEGEMEKPKKYSERISDEIRTSGNCGILDFTEKCGTGGITAASGGSFWQSVDGNKQRKKELYSERCRVLVLQPAVQCNGRDGGLASFYTSDLAGGMDSVKVV